MSLKGYIEERGSAIGVSEATGYLLDRGLPVTEADVRELHTALDGPIVGRSMVVTPEIGEAIEAELETMVETGDAEGDGIDQDDEDPEDDDEDSDSDVG